MALPTSTLQFLHCSALPSAEEQNVRGAVAVVWAGAAELGTPVASAAAAVELLLQKLKSNPNPSDTGAAAGAVAVYAPTG